jgi:glycosyltransferase involved in cell wall biosynthesis
MPLNLDEVYSKIMFKSKRIAHLTSAHPRNDIRVFLKECQSLAFIGYEIFLVVADGLGDDIVSGVKIIDVGCSKGRFNRMFHVTQLVFLKAIELDFDIYHLHDPELLPIGLKLKGRGKKVLFDSHEDVPKQILCKHYLKPWIRYLISWGFTLYERYACARFDGVIAATPFIRDKFLPINHQTIDINNYPMIGELNSSVLWQDKKNEVSYIGGIAEIRGIKEMVRAMALTRSDSWLNLVGEFSEVFVQEEVATYSGWDRINATGLLDRSDVRDVLARSMAGLVTLHPTPNYLDSLPIKMFEYMSAGIPVIASNFPLWKEIIFENQCGICVDPMNPLAIAKAIDYLIEHPDHARQMGENGRKAVLSKYNWSQEEIKFFKFYEQILSA